MRCGHARPSQNAFVCDCCAQYFPVRDATTNLLAMNITKYWLLFDQLTKDAAENVAYQNAFRTYFENWDIPKASGQERRYVQIDPMYETECLDPEVGTFVSGIAEFDESGMY